MILIYGKYPDEAVYSLEVILQSDTPEYNCMHLNYVFSYNLKQRIAITCLVYPDDALAPPTLRVLK